MSLRHPTLESNRAQVVDLVLMAIILRHHTCPANSLLHNRDLLVLIHCNTRNHLPTVDMSKDLELIKVGIKQVLMYFHLSVVDLSSYHLTPNTIRWLHYVHNHIHLTPFLP